MERLGRFRWKRLRLIEKLILVYIPLIILPITASMYVVTVKYNDLIRENTIVDTGDILSFLREKMDSQLYRFEEISLRFFVDEEIIRLLETVPVTPLEELKQRQMVQNRIEALLVDGNRGFVRSCILIAADGEYRVGERNVFPAGANDAFMRRIEQGNGKAVWDVADSDGSGYPPTLLLGRMINQVDGKKMNTLGRLVLVIDPAFLADILKESKLSDHAALRLFWENGKELLTVGAPVGPDPDKLAIPVEGQYAHWRLSADVSLTYLNRLSNQIKTISFAFTAVCVLIGLALTRIIAMDLIIPINRLMLNMKNGIKGMGPGHLKKIKGAKEVAELNDTFISLMYEIRLLNTAILENQKRKQDAEMRVLQNQLSPHFLYNTLNSIRWIAMIHKQDSIKEIVDSLTSLLSYSIRGPGQPVALREELAILNDYANIQSVRFQHFQFVADVADELADLRILKFLLQPLIENALIHGLSKSERRGEIRLEAQRDEGRLLLALTDNGCGIGPERLASIRAMLTEEGESRHLGLRSIRERIQLQYGSRYGLTIDSEPERGTVVRLVLPIIEAEGGTAHEERHDRG